MLTPSAAQFAEITVLDGLCAREIFRLECMTILLRKCRRSGIHFSRE